MITVDTPFGNALAAPVNGVLFLIELAFTGGTLRLTNWPLDVVALSQTWQGLGALASIGNIHESEDGSSEKLTVGLSQVKQSQLALALGGVETYQGRSAKVWQSMVDPTSMQVTGAPVLRWAGFMDKVRVERREGAGTVYMDMVTFAGDTRKNPAGLRYSDAQHQAEHPGELGFSYVIDMIGKPALWLTKRFQEI